MKPATLSRFWWFLILLTIACGLLALAACGTAVRSNVTPTPTRTPRPTATFTPVPTPTPAWPITVGCGETAPETACTHLGQWIAQDTTHFTWIESPNADLTLTTEANVLAQFAGYWTYAVVAPFFTIEDQIALADLQATWRGQPAGSLVEHPLLITADTRDTLAPFWGPPGDPVRIVQATDLLTQAIQLDGWSILPFDDLDSRWKVLLVDGISLLERDLDPTAYPLSFPLYLWTDHRPDVFPLLSLDLSNRDETKMTIVAMTGVTALTRGTANTMEQLGVTYPAQDIGEWLREADLTHISNEVSFTPNCPVPPIMSGTTFCSHDQYIELLEAVGTDIVELTGNHNNDYGIEPDLHTLEMFRERGWQWFGGGANWVDATRPLTVTLGPNRLAFVGCNAFGPEYAWATETTPGAVPCKETADLERVIAQVAQLRAEGWLPIVTVQAYETYQYFPTPKQLEDFRALSQAGAVVVQGSQAHHPQAIEFYQGGFIHYGLGNLFFDQMQSLGTRQEFIDRLVFYDGRLLSVELRTAMLEEYARPRPMTAEERQALLESVFAESGWGTE